LAGPASRRTAASTRCNVDATGTAESRSGAARRRGSRADSSPACEAASCRGSRGETTAGTEMGDRTGPLINRPQTKGRPEASWCFPRASVGGSSDLIWSGSHALASPGLLDPSQGRGPDVRPITDTGPGSRGRDVHGGVGGRRRSSQSTEGRRSFLSGPWLAGGVGDREKDDHWEGRRGGCCGLHRRLLYKTGAAVAAWQAKLVCGVAGTGSPGGPKRRALQGRPSRWNPPWNLLWFPVAGRSGGIGGLAASPIHDLT